MALQILNYPELIKKIDSWGYFLGQLYKANQLEKAVEFCELINPILDKIIKLNMYKDFYEDEGGRR